MRTLLRSLALTAIITIPLSYSAQTINVDNRKAKLAAQVKYVDANNNDSITVDEAIAVFECYLTNPARNLKSELVEDVESVLIDLISYLETINCTSVKRTEASKRFIELYYVNKLKPNAGS